MVKTCENCRFYKSGKKWVYPMNGEVSYICKSNGCCYHWEALPSPNALSLRTKHKIDENGNSYTEFYVIKDEKEVILK